MTDRVVHAALAKFLVRTHDHSAMLRCPYGQRVVARLGETNLAGRVGPVLLLPQHHPDCGIHVVIEKKEHYPAGASMRWAARTSAASRSGKAFKMATVSNPFRR